MISFILLIAAVVSALMLPAYSQIRAENKLFEYHNPYNRTCKKCGACQHMYQYSYGGNPWWEEMYPIGNNEKCNCHSYSDNHG